MQDSLDVEYDASFDQLARAVASGDWKTNSGRNFLRGISASNRANLTDTKSGKSVLHVAACSDNGSLEVLLGSEHVRELINAADFRGVTPLMEAVLCGNVSAVKLFIALGAALNSVSHYAHQNVLHAAVATNRKECLAELIQSGSAEDILDEFDGDGNTPLMLCAPLVDCDCALMLLQEGARAELRNPNTGRNILHLAILERNMNLVEELLKPCELDLANRADSFGDTAFRLAVRMDDSATIKMLLNCPKAQEFVWEFPEVTHHAITHNDSDLFTQVLPLFGNKELMSCTDSQGRTPLMLAVELGRNQMIKDLFKKGVRASLLRDSQGESVLHKAVNSGDIEILTLLLQGGNRSDFSEETALEAALASGKVECFAVMWKSGVFPNKPLNSKQETALFLAAKYSNYGSFLLILMSPQCVNYAASVILDEPVSTVDLERAYLQKHIFASDLYIMTGKKETNTEWNFCPPLAFQPTANGRTIFHACALGGLLEIASFYYKFCKMFYPAECDKIDEPDHQGTTPLHLASQCDHKEIEKFFLLKRANLCKEDDRGESPLTTTYKNASNHADFIEEILSNCVVYDGWKSGEEDADPKALIINFSLLCPQGEPYMRVISNIFQTYRDFNDSEFLLHPLLRYYVFLMMPNVGVFLKTRYTVAVSNAFAFTAYLVMKYCLLVPIIPVVMWFLHGLSLVCFVLTAIWSMPLTFLPTHKPFRWFEGKSTLVPSVLGIIYLVLLNGDDRTSLEVAASAALLSWMALMSFSVTSPLRQQKAMFQVVFASMYPYLPIYLLVTTGFCFFFFVLFHDYFAFSNPFHALLFAAFQLPRGDLGLIPVLSDKNQPIRGPNSTHFRITKDKTDPNDPVMIDTNQELRSMLVEGTVLVFFLLVTFTITNLLTALAVKSKDIAVSGDVYELSSQVDRLEKWELFLSGKHFSRLKNLKLLWLLCTHSSARERFVPPKFAYPLDNKPKRFELFMIKNHFTRREDLVTNKPVRLFLEWYPNRGRRVNRQSIRSSFNKMFLDI